MGGWIFWKDLNSALHAIVNVILNMLLIQTWTPTASSLNGVSWYLSVTFFLYFMFPLYLKKMEKDYTVTKACKSMLLIFFIEYIIAICVHVLSDAFVERWTTLDVEYWFLYMFPPVRMLDFLIGCNAGYLFLRRDKIKISCASEKVYTYFELVAISLSALLNSLFYLFDEGTLAVPIDGVCWAAIYVAPSLMVVWLFAVEKGRITKLLTNKVLINLGNISPYTFLIHSVALRYIDYIWKIIERIIGRSIVFDLSPIKLTVGFVLTLLATKIWMSIEGVYKSIPKMIRVRNSEQEICRDEEV